MKLFLYPLCVAVSYFVLACNLHAQSAKVLTVFDFAAQLNTATISKPVTDVSLSQATIQGETKTTVYQHPNNPDDAPSRITYQVQLPPKKSTQYLFLSVETYLSNEIQWNDTTDGVRFRILIDGIVMLDEVRKESGSHAHCIDLQAYCGRKVSVVYETTPLGNTIYDWAHWVEPTILQFVGSIPLSKKSGTEDWEMPITEGILAFRHEGSKPLSLEVVCSDTNRVHHWSYSPQKEGLRWSLIPYNFKGANDVRLHVAGEQEANMPREVVMGYSAFDLDFEYFNPSLSLITPDVPMFLRYKVTNRGRGVLPANAGRVVVYDQNEKILGHSILPQLAKDESWIGDIPYTAPSYAGSVSVVGKLFAIDPYASLVKKSSSKLDEAAQYSSLTANFNVVVTAAERDSGFVRRLENSQMRVHFNREANGIASASIQSFNGKDWERVAVWRPLARITLNTKQGPIPWEPTFTQIIRSHAPSEVLSGSVNGINTNAWCLVSQANDPMGNPWHITLTASLNPQKAELDISYAWKCENNVNVHNILGPNIYVGEGSFGESKIAGLFPGLEYLHGAEQSSSTRDFALHLADRRSPSYDKITIPLMAISWGTANQPAVLNPGKFYCPDSSRNYWTAGDQAQKTIGLYWDPFQKWDAVHAFPTPRFSSPNLDEGMQNHRLALYLPSCPDYLVENQNWAMNWNLEAQKTYTLSSHLAITDGPILTSVRHYLDRTGGLLHANKWPRSQAAERALCRTGFDTVWDGTNKWSHCVGWPMGYAPNFALLHWLDAQSAPSAESQKYLQTRLEPVVEAILKDQGPAGLSSSRNCHILTDEFPFHYGYLEEAWGPQTNAVRAIISRQQQDGSWVFAPNSSKVASLGQAGDATMGTVALETARLLRYARITGDSVALEAGMKGLSYLSRFAVPRGGQVWECPIYQPDILPAAYAMQANLEAWRITGQEFYITKALYWAETGVPFIYLWTYPDTPMMLGATIPVFGSTFYTHTWLGVPVQWNGLVYSYHLQHLIHALMDLEKAGKHVPSTTLKFSISDWQGIVNNIVASAVHQQCTEGDLMGTYPDSISNFKKRNAAFINPEDILLNILAMDGFDPEIQTLVIPGTNMYLSHVGKVTNLKSANAEVSFNVQYFANCNANVMICGVEHEPTEILVGKDEALPKLEEPVRLDTGWHYNAEQKRVYITVSSDSNVTIKM